MVLIWASTNGKPRFETPKLTARECTGAMKRAGVQETQLYKKIAIMIPVSSSLVLETARLSADSVVVSNIDNNPQ